MKLPNLTRNQMILLFAICLGIVFAAIGIFGARVEAQEPREARTLADEGFVRIGSTLTSTETTTTRTTGYVQPSYDYSSTRESSGYRGSEYVDLETTTDSSGNSVTTGYIGDDYVELETEAD